MLPGVSQRLCRLAGTSFAPLADLDLERQLCLDCLDAWVDLVVVKLGPVRSMEGQDGEGGSLGRYSKKSVVG